MQLVELTWLIGQFCLLNRWFRVLQVPDEGPQDEADFLAAYHANVPEDIRKQRRDFKGRVLKSLRVEVQSGRVLARNVSR